MRRKRAAAAPYWRSCLALFLFAYNSIANTSLRFFECVDVAGGRWHVLQSSPAVDCESSAYKRALPLFGCGLALVVASPLLLLYWLRRPHVRALVDRSGPREHGVWGVLFSMYRGGSSSVPYHWTVVVLVRRVAVVATGVVFLSYGHSTRYAAWTTAHALVLMLHVVYQPFRDLQLGTHTVRMNVVESVSLFLLVVLSAAVSAASLPFTDGQAVGFSVIVFGWMLVLAVMVAVQVYHTRRKQRSGSDEMEGWGAKMSTPLLELELEARVEG